MPKTQIKTIEDRLRTVEKNLTVLTAALSTSDGDVDTQILLAALRELAHAAAEETYWLTLVPAEVLATLAPTGDERDEMEEEGVER